MSERDLCISCALSHNQRCPMLPKSGTLPITECDSYRNVWDELAITERALEVACDNPTIIKQDCPNYVVSFCPDKETRPCEMGQARKCWSKYFIQRATDELKERKE